MSSAVYLRIIQSVWPEKLDWGTDINPNGIEQRRVDLGGLPLFDSHSNYIRDRPQEQGGKPGVSRYLSNTHDHIV